MPSAKLQSVEALRLRHVQRPEHESIECAEDHGVCANRHGKRHDGNSGKTGRLVQHAEGETKVDRKSTRLNSSHGYISYAVFCLKKKKKIHLHNNQATMYLAPRSSERGADRRRS